MVDFDDDTNYYYYDDGTNDYDYYYTHHGGGAYSMAFSAAYSFSFGGHDGGPGPDTDEYEIVDFDDAFVPDSSYVCSEEYGGGNCADCIYCFRPDLVGLDDCADGDDTCNGIRCWGHGEYPPCDCSGEECQNYDYSQTFPPTVSPAPTTTYSMGYDDDYFCSNFTGWYCEHGEVLQVNGCDSDSCNNCTGGPYNQTFLEEYESWTFYNGWDCFQPDTGSILILIRIRFGRIPLPVLLPQ